MPLWVRLVLCVATAYFASRRGRSEFWWFILGLILPLVSLVLVIVLPDQADATAQRVQDQEHLTRMRERVRKERQVADSRYRDLERRLDRHDSELGVDTRGERELGTDRKPPPALSDSQWYVVRDGEAVGPMAFSALRAMWRDGVLFPASLVWTEGMSDWRRVNELDSLREELSV